MCPSLHFSSPAAPRSTRRWLLAWLCVASLAACRAAGPATEPAPSVSRDAGTDAGASRVDAGPTVERAAERPRLRPPVRPPGRCFPSDTAVSPPRALTALLDRAAERIEQAAQPPSTALSAAEKERLGVSDARAALLTESLICTDEALRAEPHSIEALESRARALMERSSDGDLDGARDAITLALALDPDDPHTLASAAELYVHFLSASDEHSTIALEYARRGSRLCARQLDALLAKTHGRPQPGGRRQPASVKKAAKPAPGLLRNQRLLGARLALLEGQALGDLGRAQESLARLDAAIALADQAEAPAPGASRRGPGTIGSDARYERALALFDLCRFTEAKQAFEDVLGRLPATLPTTAPPPGASPLTPASPASAASAASRSTAPTTAWVQHYLGLTLEMLGQPAAAERALAEARRIAPTEFPEPLAIDAAAFRALVDAEVAALPAPLRADLRQVELETAELPDVRDLLADVPAGHPPLAPTILGLFRGLPLSEGELGPRDEPRAIVLYRKNLIRTVRSRQELIQEIRTTLLHELGHLRGEDDDMLRDRGLE